MTTSTASRIYVVSDPLGGNERLVRAHHPGNARKAATDVRLASQGDLERLLTKGARVYDATALPDDEAQPSLV